MPRLIRSCKIPGQYEFLFSSFADCSSTSGRSGYCSVIRTGGIHMFLGCEDGDATPSSTVDTGARGHSILRVVMTDDDGKHLTFDVDINLAQGASKTATSWVHVSMAVTRNSIRTYIDGKKVANDQIGCKIDTIPREFASLSSTCRLTREIAGSCLRCNPAVL